MTGSVIYQQRQNTCRNTVQTIGQEKRLVRDETTPGSIATVET